MTIEFAEINWLAVVVAAFATFMLGGAWYTALFGKAWQKAHGLTDEQLKQQQTVRPMHVFLAMQFVCYIAIAFGMALLVNGAGITTAGGGATLGFCVWLIVAAVVLTNHLPTPVTWTGYFINVSYSLIYCVGSGALLGAWQ
jgi:hypothetical protein